MSHMLRRLAAVALISVMAGCTSSASSVTGAGTGSNPTANGSAQAAAFTPTAGRKIGYDYTTTAGGQTTTVSWTYEIVSVANGSATIKYTINTGGQPVSTTVTVPVTDGLLSLPGVQASPQGSGGATESITVKAGTYNATKTTVTTPGGSISVWVANNLLVKEVISSPSSTVTLELSSLQ